MTVLLCVEAAEFPTGILDLSIYKGKKELTELMFWKCDFDQIVVNNATWHINAEHIIFQEMSLDMDGLEPFNTFTNMRAIHFRAIKLYNVGDRCFQHVKQSLIELLIEFMPYNITMGYLFDYERVWKITVLNMKGECTSLPKLLTMNNFSSLPILHELRLAQFGIYAIEENAFDFIAKTLEKLDLTGNQLKHIQSATFYKLIENFITGSIQIRLNENPLECNCEYRELENVGRWNELYFPENVWVQMQCSSADQTTCNTQTISNENLCIKDIKNIQYKYPKFVLTINGRMNVLSIKTNVKYRYRLWIYNFKRIPMGNESNFIEKICPGKVELAFAAKCFLFKNESEIISLNGFMRATGTIGLCVNYVSRGNKRFWPLHCITYSIEFDMFKEHIYGILIVGIVASLSGLIWGAILTKAIYLRFFHTLPDHDRIMEQAKKRQLPTISFADATKEFKDDDYYEIHDYESITEFEYLKVIDALDEKKNNYYDLDYERPISNENVGVNESILNPLTTSMEGVAE